jgi:DNA-binding LacI/PurR family transcriptional regulator
VTVHNAKDKRCCSTCRSITDHYFLCGERHTQRSDTEARICEAIKELHFKPDHIARSLRAKRTMTVEGGTAAGALLNKIHPPTAIFATNNLMTAGLFVTIKQRGLRCPEDIAVVGFDDMVCLSAFSPGLTTIAQPGYELGKQAAELLWKEMGEKKAGNLCPVILPAKLVIRESWGQAIRTATY